MTLSYRFEWNPKKAQFDEPSNWQDQTNSEKCKSMLEITGMVQSRSGLKECSSRAAIYITLLIFILLSGFCGYLIKIRSEWGHRLIVAMPFISFSSMAYFLLRRPALQSINRYLENNRVMIDMLVHDHKLSVNYYFWISGCNEAQRIDLESIGSDKTKIVQERSYFKRICHRKCVQGYIEFVESKKKSSVSSILGGSQLAPSINLISQPAEFVIPEAPKPEGFKPTISLETRPFSPVKMRKFTPKNKRK